MLVIAKNVKYEDCGSLSNRLRRKQRYKVEIENRAAASHIIMMMMVMMMAMMVMMMVMMMMAWRALYKFQKSEYGWNLSVMIRVRDESITDDS